MTFEEFCILNGSTQGESLSIMDNCVIPEEDITTNFTLVIYSSRGSAEFEIDGERHVMQHRSIMVLRDGKRVRRISQSDDFKSKTMAIGGDMAMELRLSSSYLSMFIIDSRPVLRVTSAYGEAAKLFFEALTRACQFNDNPYKEECVKSILRAFFYSTGYYAFEMLGYNGKNLFKIAMDLGDGKEGQVAKFIRLTENYAKTNRSLSFYAEKMDYNPKYLSAMIKRETGFSGQYLIDQYALLGAMAKLRCTRSSIKEISNEMEFPSQSDFGKFFKRMTGMSPLAYRKSKFHRK